MEGDSFRYCELFYWRRGYRERRLLVDGGESLSPIWVSLLVKRIQKEAAVSR